MEVSQSRGSFLIGYSVIFLLWRTPGLGATLPYMVGELQGNEPTDKSPWFLGIQVNYIMNYVNPFLFN
jgi:hypothetical protein